MEIGVIKRDGRIVAYDNEYIGKAIEKAVNAVESAIDITGIMLDVEKRVMEVVSSKGTKNISVEDIQDLVERSLIAHNYDEVAKAYILYRQKRTEMREQNNYLMQTFDTLGKLSAAESDLKRENANINSDSAMGTMLKFGTESFKYYVLNSILPKEMAYHHECGDYHIHDLDFFWLTMTCCQIDIADLLQRGFSTGHGFLRQPSNINSAAALTCIAIQANQNDQHGGQSVFAIDYALAPYVQKTYIEKIADIVRHRYFTEVSEDTLKVFIHEWKQKALTVTDLMETNDKKTTANYLLYIDIREQLGIKISYTEWLQLIQVALNDTIHSTEEAMEALIHNLNTMHSRAGAQVPFSSINFGTCTTIAGRMVIKSILKALNNGLGKGETSIFPVAIFKIKEGINYNPEDPNYDCFCEACAVTAKRLFPNFAFIDAPYNKKFYVEGKPETEVAYMGCRTRVMANYYDKNKQFVARRGNLSFTTINLPRLAIKAKIKREENNWDVKTTLAYFYKLLDEMLNAVVAELDFRFEVVAQRTPRNFPILMQQGVWLDSEKLHMDESIREVMKHGSLSVGFIGLAECLIALIGKHHGESDEAQKLGLEIVGYMHNYLQGLSEERHLNYTLLATPAEGLSGRFVKMDRKIYGTIDGVTDREYYTNSNHVPVYYKINAANKIAIEAPYHALTDAGHICYVELDGDLTQNPEAIMSVVRHMKENGVGYGAINHPVDQDPVCGYVGVINDVCPRCGRREGEPMSDEMWERLRLGKYLNSAYDETLVTGVN